MANGQSSMVNKNIKTKKKNYMYKRAQRSNRNFLRFIMAIGFVLLVMVTVMWYLAFRQKAIYDSMKNEAAGDSTVVTVNIDTLNIAN